MATYHVLLIRKGIKRGQVIPYGSSHELTVKNVWSKTDARAEAKKRMGDNWVVQSASQVIIKDPDAR